MNSQNKFGKEMEKFKVAILKKENFSDEEILKFFEMKILDPAVESVEDVKDLFELTEFIKNTVPMSTKN